MSDLTNGGVQTLTVTGIQRDLNNGLTRPQIQAKYNLSGKDLKELFSHPKLKGLKTKVAPSFKLVDDTLENDEEVENTIASNSVEGAENASQDEPESELEFKTSEQF